MHIRTNPKLNKVFKPLILFCEWLGVHHPVLLMRIRYFARFKKALHLKHPKTLNEKMLFLSLKTDTSLWTKCADKYAVREYVKERGVEDILVPLYGVWDDVAEIDFNALPNEFVLKTTHGSGEVVIIRDKAELDVPSVVKTFKKYLSKRYGALEGGHHYIRIVPRVIAEKLLHNDFQTTKLSSSIIDYNIW